MICKKEKNYLHYYHDKYDDFLNYRVDRITEIEILDQGAKSFKKEMVLWQNVYITEVKIS